MSSGSRSRPSLLAILLVVAIAITLTVYLLRGLGILTFIPGGVIYLLILLSLALGIAWRIQENRRL